MTSIPMAYRTTTATLNDYDSGTREQIKAFLVDAVNKVFQHFFRDLEIRDNAVNQRVDSHDVRRGFADHFLGFFAHRHDLGAFDVYGYD